MGDATLVYLAGAALVFLALLALVLRLRRPETGAGDDADLRRRVEALERQMALLQARVDPAAPPLMAGATPLVTLPAGVQAALLGGNTIEAIKLYRQATGVGLKEAKDAIDAARQ